MKKKMNFEEWKTWVMTTDLGFQRRGQLAFNSLVYELGRDDIAKFVSGKWFDPFHNDKNLEDFFAVVERLLLLDGK